MKQSAWPGTECIPYWCTLVSVLGWCLCSLCLSLKFERGPDARPADGRNDKHMSSSRYVQLIWSLIKNCLSLAGHRCDSYSLSLHEGESCAISTCAEHWFNPAKNRNKNFQRNSGGSDKSSWGEGAYHGFPSWDHSSQQTSVDSSGFLAIGAAPHGERPIGCCAGW